MSRHPTAHQPDAPTPEAYLGELADLVMLHARAQGLAPRTCARLLAGIRDPSGDGPTSWPTVWSAAGDRHADAGRHLPASRFYNLARFPYVDGPARAAAHRRCVAEFERWALPRGYERHQLTVGSGGSGGSGKVVVWTATPPNPREAPPLLLVTGGIVSTKEQWGSLLGLAGRLEMAVAVTEMPGVGENTMPYDADAWRIYPALLDQLADVADTGTTYLLALSFSGHLALRASLHDRRIRGIATVGAPVTAFFQDTAWFTRLPETTVRTLAHLTGTDHAELPGLLAPWALADELADVGIPVHYVASRHDEIIPPDDPARLARLVPCARVVEHDDVHGSPNHLLETRLWIARSLLDMRGLGSSPPARVLRGLQAIVTASSAAKSGVSSIVASRRSAIGNHLRGMAPARPAGATPTPGTAPAAGAPPAAGEGGRAGTAPATGTAPTTGPTAAAGTTRAAPR